MNQLHTIPDLESRLAARTTVLYKHSTRCPISAAAHRQMEAFLERSPDAPVFMVDVHAAEELSDYIVEKTGIGHESPQLILLRGGKPVWSIAHSAITAQSLEEQLAARSRPSA